MAEALVAEGHSVEIVNADAMQLYRGMDIGTAKLPVAERRGFQHHLLDVLDVTDEASVADYQLRARASIDAIRSRGAVPILVGGSGLYVSSVIFDFRFPGTDPTIRARLEASLGERGPGWLHQQLHARDAEAAAAIGPHNARRIVRALEVIELTGEPFGSGLPDENDLSRPTVIFGARVPRAALVERLNDRVARMWRDGLLDEVRGLIPAGLELGVTARRAIGYAQAIAQLRGEVDEATAIEQTAALTRKYARRQMSWFKRYPQLHWVDEGEADRVERAVAVALGYA